MSKIYTDGPIVGVNWEEVDFIHCTLETPFKNGGLRFRLGSGDAKQNVDWNAYDQRRGPRFWPGAPIMYPEKEPAIAGDPKRNAWLMPASVSAMTMTRKGEPIQDGKRHAGFVAFGFFYAPLEEDPAIVGFTQSTERSRVASFWAGFKFPDDRSNKGRPQPQMTRIAAPDVPDVTIRPLGKSMTPILDEHGNEIKIRVREFWDFNRADQYSPEPESLPVLPAQDEVAAMLKGMTDKEREFLLQMVRKGAANGPK